MDTKQTRVVRCIVCKQEIPNATRHTYMQVPNTWGTLIVCYDCVCSRILVGTYKGRIRR